MPINLLNYIYGQIEKPITYDEWCYIRRHGDPDEIAAAVERMEAAGGYDCLD